MTTNEVRFKGRLIGYLDLERKLYLSHRSAIHFFRKFNGFGLNQVLLGELVEKGYSIRIIYNDENGKVFIYQVSAKEFYEKSVIWNELQECQKILSVEYMKLIAGPERRG